MPVPFADTPPLPPITPAPFADTAQKLKALRDKLNFNTYAAVFGRTVEERQQATTAAAKLAKQIEDTLMEALVVASSVMDLGRATSHHEGLLVTVDKYLRVFEEPVGSRMQSGSSASSPCNMAASLVAPPV